MNISDVKIFEHNLGTGNVTGKIAILFGGLSASNPKSYMDKVVNEYVGNNPYTQFIDIHLDNPWLRVVISGINELNFDDFKKQRL